MTAPCNEWRIVAVVDANQSSRSCFTADGGIFRIVTRDEIKAPSFPTYGASGMLMAKPNVAHIVAGCGVRMAPLSGAR